VQGGLDMFSAFHPSVLFCTDIEWQNDYHQDTFIQILLEHLKIIDDFNINIAWTNDYINYFWQNVPWVEDTYWSTIMVDTIYQRLSNHEIILSPPPDDPCFIVNHNLDYNDAEVTEMFHILLHRLLFMDVKIHIIIEKSYLLRINQIEIDCYCSKCEKSEAALIKSRDCWYNSMDYIDKWPLSIRNWTVSFLCANKICQIK